MDPDLDSDSASDCDSASDVNCPALPSSLHSGRWLQQWEEKEEIDDQQLVSFVVALPKLLSQQGCPCPCEPPALGALRSQTELWRPNEIPQNLSHALSFLHGTVFTD